MQANRRVEQSTGKLGFQESLYQAKNPTRRYLHSTRRDIVSSFVTKYGRGTRALEVGVGADVYGPVMAERFPCLVRLDIEREYLVPLVRSAGAAMYLQADVTSLPFRDESFDFILFSEVIEHVDPEKSLSALSELRRVLRREGVITLSTPQRYSSVEQTARLIRYFPFRQLARIVYGKDIASEGGILDHRNLLTSSALSGQLRKAGMDIVESRRCGMYVPVVAEALGERGAGISRYLEKRIRENFMGGLLWTQILVLSKRSR